MRGILLILVFTNFLLGIETSLGGLTLGEPFSAVAAKYTALDSWKNTSLTPLPFPLSLETSGLFHCAQSKNLFLQCYFDDNKKLRAVSVFRNQAVEDKHIYETSAGLRLLDGVIELKLLYGIPQDISEYSYKEPSGTTITRRIYYYPNLYIQTKRYNKLPEYIELIVLGKYNMHNVLQKKDSLLNRNI